VLLKSLKVGMLCAAVTGLFGGELPAEVQAKFIKILCASAGSAGKVACREAGLAAELTKVGLTVDPSSKVIWAASDSEARAGKSMGKLVICGHTESLPLGGAIAIVEEGGKPQIYLHMGNIAASGITLSDAVLKIGRKL
jgi:hypothetical protein